MVVSGKGEDRGPCMVCTIPHFRKCKMRAMQALSWSLFIL